MTLERTIFSNSSKLIIGGNLISNGDRILVGFSGGKDSHVLLKALLNFKKKSITKFEIVVAMIDSGFEWNLKDAKDYLDSVGVEYIIEKTEIFNILKKKFPLVDSSGKYCFLCSRLRRGALYNLCEKFKCNKLALGHNFDDAIETYMLNLFYGSSSELMKPKYLTDDSKYEVIRPLLFVKEKDIIEYVNSKKFPIIKQKCPLKKKDSKREEMRQYLEENYKKNWMLYKSFKNAMYKDFK